MAIHILGNGPSIQLFDRSAWPESDVFVGCNFSDTELRPHYTVMVDVRPMQQFRRGNESLRLKIPAVLTTRSYDYITNNCGWDNVPSDSINVIDIMDLMRDRNVSKHLAMNSAQHACMYAAKQEVNHITIHLWGIDSFWSHDLTSTTDSIVRPEYRGSRVKPQIVRQWERYWRMVFDKCEDHQFMIHMPTGNRLIIELNNRSNVRVEEHTHAVHEPRVS